MSLKFCKENKSIVSIYYNASILSNIIINNQHKMPIFINSCMEKKIKESQGIQFYLKVRTKIQNANFIQSSQQKRNLFKIKTIKNMCHCVFIKICFFGTWQLLDDFICQHSLSPPFLSLHIMATQNSFALEPISKEMPLRSLLTIRANHQRRQPSPPFANHQS